MSIKSQVTHGLKWQAITIVGKHLLSIAVFTLLARMLDPAAFGLVALVSLYAFFATIIGDAGLGAALIQRQNLEPEHLDSAFWFNVGVVSLICAATLLLAEPVAALLGEPAIAPLLRWSSLGLVLNASANIHQSLFIRAMDFRRPALRTLLANSAGGAVGLSMAFAGYGVWSLIGQQLTGAFVAAVFLWVASTYRPSLRFSPRHFRDLIGVGSSIFGNGLIWFFASRADQMVIGRFAGAPVLGLYVIAGKVPELLKGVTAQPIQEVSIPAFAKLQHDLPKLRDAIYRGMGLNATVIFPVYLGIAVVAPDLIPFLFGNHWTEAASICSLLAFHVLLSTLHVFYYPALLASGGARQFLVIGAAQAAGVVIACLIGIRFGIHGLVVGLIINTLVFTAPGLLFLRRRIGLSLRAYSRPCLIPTSAALIMAGAAWSLRLLLDSAPPLVRLSAMIVVGAGVYTTLLAILKPALLRELVALALSTLGRSRQT